jgi:hypothetical protein
VLLNFKRIDIFQQNTPVEKLNVVSFAIGVIGAGPIFVINQIKIITFFGVIPQSEIGNQHVDTAVVLDE